MIRTNSKDADWEWFLGCVNLSLNSIPKCMAALTVREGVRYAEMLDLLHGN